MPSHSCHIGHVSVIVASSVRVHLLSFPNAAAAAAERADGSLNSPHDCELPSGLTGLIGLGEDVALRRARAGSAASWTT